MPILLNPAKGFIVNCNNRIVPEGATEYGVGSTRIGNLRANRAEEVLSRAIKDVKEHRRPPLDIKDMEKLQYDFRDGFAAMVMPRMARLTRASLSGYPEFSQHRGVVSKMLAKIEGWDFMVTKDSVAALIYSVWMTEFKRTMLHKLFSDQEERYVHAFSYCSDPFVSNLVARWDQGKDLGHEACEFAGKKNCTYNLAYSLVESYKYLVDTLGENMVLITPSYD